MQLQDDTRALFDYDEFSMTECAYQSTQIFYTNEPANAQEADTITSIEYSRDGEHLAVGDRGGRIWIYSTNDGRNKCKPKPFSSFGGADTDEKQGAVPDEEQVDVCKDSEHGRLMSRGVTYDFYGQFQSHQPEFDYLKSLEIEEKINCMTWCRTWNNSLSLLAANDKTIKLWKVFEKSMYRPRGSSFRAAFQQCPGDDEDHKFANVRLPRIETEDVITAAISRRVYQNGHKFHIHSLDVNCDCETFISADDLRVNLWHFDSPNTAFNLCDLLPDSMEQLTNTITKAILHPLHCNYMAYTTSQAQICFCDMRQNCHIDNNKLQMQHQTSHSAASAATATATATTAVDDVDRTAASDAANGYGHHPFASTKVFQYQQPLIHRDFFTDLAAYISDVTFTHDGNQMITRDYFNAYVWDVRNHLKPLRIIPVHPYFANDLRHLYESDLIFDKFEVVASPSSMSIATGTYNNSFVVANYETAKIQKCVLNPNHVLQFQNRLKKNQKKLKKMKKLNKLSGNAASSSVQQQQQQHEEAHAKNKKPAAANANLNASASEDAVQKPTWLQSNYFQKGNFDQKTLHLSWHPKKDIIAAVSGSQLIVFQKL